VNFAVKRAIFRVNQAIFYIRQKKTAPFWGAVSLTGRKSYPQACKKTCDKTHPKAELLTFRFRYGPAWAMTFWNGDIQKVIHV
jgi:hypothetical protein